MITDVMQIPNSQRDQMIERGSHLAARRNGVNASFIASGAVEEWSAEDAAIMLWNEEF